MLNPNADRNVDPKPAGPSPSAAIADLEKRMEEFFAAQKSEVEEGLLAKINREKEEAQRKIETARQEFEKVRGILEEHRAVIAELESAREGLQSRIQEHFDRVVDHQKLMEKAATLSIDEIETVDELSRELADIHRKAAAQTAALKGLLRDHSGMLSDLPSFPEAPEAPLNWSRELLKMKKVQALLTSSNGHDPQDVAAASDQEAPPAEPESEPAPEPEPATAAPPEAPDAPDAPDAPQAPEALEAEAALSDANPEAPSPSAAEPAETPETPEFSETDPGWDDIPDAAAQPLGRPDQEPAPAPDAAASRGPWLDADADAAARGASAEAPGKPDSPGAPGSPETIEDVVPEQARSTESLSKVLADYRKTEPINNGIELGFFEVGTTALLDGESFVAAIDGICLAARDLHDQLTRTESVKDLFLLKQEILNQQEVLRKLYFRVVRFCDKESGALPTFLEDIINVPAMKDCLERLTMANWSDPSDFAPFVREIETLKESFAARTDPPGDYIQSVLEQVGLN